MSQDVLLSSCNTCNASHGVLILRCSSCKIVRYCSQEHQASDWANHKLICNKIKRLRHKMKAEEELLRNSPGGPMSRANPFRNAVGHFWGLMETRGYMRARMDMLISMLEINTHDSVLLCLENFLDMLRLCRSDNLGVRNTTPGLFLRLNRDQNCYDFVKWWETVGSGHNYDWGNMRLPYLNLRNEDVMEGIEIFRMSGWFSATNAIAATLIKLRMLLDLRDFLALSVVYQAGDKLPYDIICLIQDELATRSPIWSTRPELLASEALEGNVELLNKQTNDLYGIINNSNEWFWKALLEHERYLDLEPAPFSTGSQEETAVLVQNHAKAWLETEGAIDWINGKVR